VFDKEVKFEETLVQLLLNEKGWDEVLNNPTEQDLIQNWAKILFENNRGIDRLNNHPLTEGEMQQIMEQIATLKTPLKLNGFINGKSVSITRDNPADTLHFGKEVSLNIYDRMEIAAGKSRYQIARQPKFPTKSKIASNRRGDLMLLINGMPVFHIELKKSGIPVSQATNQIETYARNGIFTGLFSLVQIFVAMNPEDCVYFANPGPDGKFNPDYFFRWADFNNEPITDWKSIASDLLSIPMAHQLIGFYTVADNADGVLKVMRSYQYYAASKISDRVTNTKWDGNNLLGGYVWHTTGSGKTLTSFKSAQLITNSNDADKVVFLMDRIELGTQSLEEYSSFAEESEAVQATENTAVLISKLKSSSLADRLIVTSIQKMSNIKDEYDGLNAKDLEIMHSKRIVFIVDEAHRSVFGEMLLTIKDTFNRAIFFGFTGTPIHDENSKKDSTTSDVFGDELHRYSIADGIRDKNVLGFDPVRVTTYNPTEVRKVVALEQAKAASEAEVFDDEKKTKVYNKFMNEVNMAGHKEKDNKYVKGIEDYLTPVDYGFDGNHPEKVVEDILDSWVRLSQNSKFHAIFATDSIPEAIEYYRLIKHKAPQLKITALFDSTIDNLGGAAFKEEGLVEIIEDYNTRYGQNFKISTHGKFKKDIANRLAHKKPYEAIARTPEKQLDLLIVVDQMLTGFDSKWVNTLYMDKVMKHANIIQAFSRTNRLFGHDKPFGSIRYYRMPFTMERNINDALKMYSGDKPFSLFVQKLGDNIDRMNFYFSEIQNIFTSAQILDFSKLPEDTSACGKFASLFKGLSDCLESAKIQGLRWEQLEYRVDDKDYSLDFDEQTYLVLALRYKELFGSSGGAGGSGSENTPYDLAGHLMFTDTGRIDTDWMNSRFDKYLKLLDSADSDMAEEALNDLHKRFATLSQDEQKFANIFLRDIRRGDVTIEDGKSLRDYITEYQTGAKNSQIAHVSSVFGLDEKLLRQLMAMRLTKANINEFGRFDSLTKTVDKTLAKAYFEKREGVTVSLFAVNAKVSKLLQEFVLDGGFDLDIES